MLKCPAPAGAILANWPASFGIAAEVLAALAYLAVAVLLWQRTRQQPPAVRRAFVVLAVLVAEFGVVQFLAPGEGVWKLAAAGVAIAIATVVFHLLRESQERGLAVLPTDPEPYRSLFETNPHPMWAFDEQTLQFLAVICAAFRATLDSACSSRSASPSISRSSGQSIDTATPSCLGNDAAT